MKPTTIQSNPPTNHRRNGNVARLPHPLRERVNRMLRDGVPYREIIRSLAKQGHKLGKSNLTRWFAGGHQDWLKEQTWLQEMNGRLEFATELMRHTDAPSLSQASLQLVTLRMFEWLTRLDPAPAAASPQPTDPATLVRLTNAVCRMSNHSRHRM